jgi:hypothetical protein
MGEGHPHPEKFSVAATTAVGPADAVLTAMSWSLVGPDEPPGTPTRDHDMRQNARGRPRPILSEERAAPPGRQRTYRPGVTLTHTQAYGVRLSRVDHLHGAAQTYGSAAQVTLCACATPNLYRALPGKRASSVGASGRQLSEPVGRVSNSGGACLAAPHAGVVGGICAHT